MEQLDKSIQEIIVEISQEKKGSPRWERLIDDLLPVLREKGSLKDWLDLYEQLPVRHDVVDEAINKMNSFWAS